MLKKLLVLCLFFFAVTVNAEESVVNIYAWASEIPDSVVNQFEKETGIHVNLGTYENNETMFAKLRASNKTGYDIVMPSSYFIDRMSKLNMLLKLDKTKLPNLTNIDTEFINPAYDPQLQYSVPFLWGVTGVFINKKYFSPNTVTKWNNLWEPRFYNKLMLVDDTRENFSIALISLGYSPNDADLEHIKQAYEKLKTIMPNVKVFATDTATSIIIDEDATAGSAWSGDAYKAHSENKNINFIFPEEGFVIWVDNFSILNNAPHVENAYKFINFILRPEIAKEAALQAHYATANQAAKKLLPKNIQNDPIMYPSKTILKRGSFLTDIGEDRLGLYEKYWEKLKLGA